MGIGAGKGPAYGMPLSPLSEYAEKNSKKRPDRLVIDAPALVDLGHGTVRYREDSSTNPILQKQADLKTGYFYHARLDDYSEDATLYPKDEFKTKYIYKGPPKARGKSLYYIYGIGMNAEDLKHQAQTTYKPKGRGYQWPSSYKNPNHFYYALTFIIKDTEENDSEDEAEDVESVVEANLMRFILHDTDTVDVLKKRTAVRLLIPSSIVHIYHNDKELGNEDLIGTLRSAEEGEFKKFTVEMKRLL
ncbi:hypothetical protein HOLleu_14447 [Holothuria leucospilota]|uniref:Uncharacterized protein n=1 Tax=Holothuria leucospilota TaxID=206669 RepID=A0A9Q1C7P3_HOLLE|nr:hypothetical protein HOLleu_14447 [Holothuria leucospilota]